MIEACARALVIWGTAGHESSLDHTLRGFGERERPGDLQMNTIITARNLYFSYQSLETQFILIIQHKQGYSTKSSGPAT